MPARTERRANARILCLIAFLAAPLPAAAAASASDNAAQLAGLFVQSCVRFVGNAKGLRDWARKTGLHEVPPEGEAAFLHGAPGRVFDATNATGKYVVVSPDDGSCSALAERADGAAVAAALEARLRDSGLAVTLAAETDDKAVRGVRHREYVVSQDRQAWQILLSIPLDGPGPAMLTAVP
ncbi:MAG: hypothetical protein JSR21_21060 [Proteobacteria bacterium]|nr:hypothetical protein [Pseudomonadota bacterium]